MRSLLLAAPQTLEVVEGDSRPLAADEVRLIVEAAGICGSDVHGFSGHNDRRPVGVVMGHETIGRVVETGHGVEFDIGARVAVNPVVACGHCRACRAASENLCENRRIYGCVTDLPGGLATELVVRGANCLVIDPDADVRGQALIEPMAVGTHAVRLSGVAAGERVLVVGGGPIGIAVVLGCLDAEAVPVVCEPQPGRRAVAERLGAETCDPGEMGDLALAFDVAFECVGRNVTLGTAIAGVHAGGTVVCLGIGESELTIPAIPLVIEERRLLGSSAYTARDFRETAAAVTARADELASLVGKTTDLDGMPQVFADYAAGRLDALKTLYLASRPGE